MQSMKSPIGTALVTGGAKRTGAAICRRLAADGWRLVVHCNRSFSEASALAQELNDAGDGGHRVVCGDLSSPGGVDAVMAQCGSLDALVNNASTYRRIAMDALTEESLRADYEINFFAPFRMMRAFAAQGRAGCIINILDQRIARLDAGSAAYSLAKMALADATRMGAMAWAPQGIRVNGVAPGYVAPPDGVPMDAVQRHVDSTPLRCRSSESQIADAVAFLIGNAAITGEILYVDAGAHLPPGK